MKPKVSILVPFFNEEENVAPLLAEVRRVCDTLGPTYEAILVNDEAILVNDGSTDATGRRLIEATKNWPEAKSLHSRANHGQAAALFFGMKHTAGDILVTLDGDGQNDPADIPRLLAVLGDFDMVAGVRAHRLDSWVRLAMSRLANAVRSKVLGDSLGDTGCGLKAFRREVMSLSSRSAPCILSWVPWRLPRVSESVSSKSPIVRERAVCQNTGFRCSGGDRSLI
jgi:glycosyltransferase involved in cell wall biosynthesis